MTPLERAMVSATDLWFARRVIGHVAEAAKVTERAMISSTRTRTITVPRTLAWYLIREVTSLTFKQVGELFGKAGTTVSQGVKALELDRESDSKHRRLLEKVLCEGSPIALEPCECPEPDAECEGCDDAHGHTCRACDEEWCQGCWLGRAHHSTCSEVTREARAG